MTTQRFIQIFRWVAFAEGLSFLILLCIAMPLKYFAHLPAAVKITGMAHGVLFVSFMALAFEAVGRLNKKATWLGWAFLSAIIPLGAFYFEKQLQKENE
jgi:integral membrane protein